MSAVVGLRERNRTAAKAEVQRVAFDLIANTGFDAVTVEEVAAAAGVSPSTVYRYFGTKDALILWDERPEQLIEAVAKRSGDSATDRFRRAAADVYGDADRRELLSQLQLVFAHESLTVAFEHALLGRRHELAALFGSRRKSGVAGVRDVATAAACLGVLLGVLERWQATGGSKSLSKMLAKGLDAVG